MPGKAEFAHGVAEEVWIGLDQLGVEQIDHQPGGPSASWRRSARVSSVGARRLIAISASQSAAREIVERISSNREALFTSKAGGGIPARPAKIASAQSGGGKVGDDHARRRRLGGERLRLGQRLVTMDQHMPAVRGERTDESGADPACPAGDDRGPRLAEFRGHAAAPRDCLSEVEALWTAPPRAAGRHGSALPVN